MHSQPHSIIDVFSSPSSSPVSTPGRDVVRHAKDEEARWRHDYYGRLERMSREAVRNGYVLDWSTRDADEPKRWLW